MNPVVSEVFVISSKGTDIAGTFGTLTEAQRAAAVKGPGVYDIRMLTRVVVQGQAAVPTPVESVPGAQTKQVETPVKTQSGATIPAVKEVPVSQAPANKTPLPREEVPPPKENATAPQMSKAT